MNSERQLDTFRDYSKFRNGQLKKLIQASIVSVITLQGQIWMIF